MIQQTATQTLTITIRNPLAVTTVSLPDGVTGKPYAVQLTAAGGNGNYTWTASGLPLGLTCSFDGMIQGTPIGTGAATPVTVTVTDSGN